jgi:hypothetical protein
MQSEEDVKTGKERKEKEGKSWSYTSEGNEENIEAEERGA